MVTNHEEASDVQSEMTAESEIYSAPVTTASTTEQAEEETQADDPKTLQDLKRSFQKLGTSTTTYIKSTMETFNSADGKTASSDMILGLEESKVELRKLFESHKAIRKQKRPQKWNFATTPLASFGKTLDDLFECFLHWAKVNEEAQEPKYNVSKAFRRLEGYATWMDNTGRDLVDPPLTTDSLEAAWKAWNMKISEDKQGRLVWWIDFGSLDQQAVKDLSNTESLRLFVWLTHYLMFDAYNHKGMVAVQNMAQMKLVPAMSLVPPQLGMKLDRFTIGILPFQMKHYYVSESAKWSSMLIRTTKTFVSKKIKERITLLADNSVLEEELGAACIPQDFPGCSGQLSENSVADKYFSKSEM